MLCGVCWRFRKPQTGILFECKQVLQALLPVLKDDTRDRAELLRRTFYPHCAAAHREAVWQDHQLRVPLNKNRRGRHIALIRIVKAVRIFGRCRKRFV